MYDLTFNVNKNEDDLSKNISQIITINHRKVDRLISSNFFVIKLLVQHYQIELKNALHHIRAVSYFDKSVPGGIS